MLLAMLNSSASLAASTTYRWVDEKGQIHYGDAMPNNQSGMGHAELDAQGRVVKRAPRTRLTETERRQRELEAERQRELEREREAQARHDQALLSTYTSEEEIDLTRDRALELEQLSLQGMQLRLDRATGRLAQINEESAKLRQIGRPVPPYMITLKADAQNEVLQLSTQILQRSRAIEDIRARYEQDKARWRVLKGLSGS